MNKALFSAALLLATLPMAKAEKDFEITPEIKEAAMIVAYQGRVVFPKSRIDVIARRFHNISTIKDINENGSDKLRLAICHQFFILVTEVYGNKMNTVELARYWYYTDIDSRLSEYLTKKGYK